MNKSLNRSERISTWRTYLLDRPICGVRCVAMRCGATGWSCGTLQLKAVIIRSAWATALAFLEAINRIQNNRTKQENQKRHPTPPEWFCISEIANQVWTVDNWSMERFAIFVFFF